MKNILVTGGSGFIGSHTCYALLAEGYEITVLDSLANSSKRSLDQIIKIFKSQDLDFSNKLRFFEGDIRNKDFINSIFKKAVEEKKPIDGVIHFAGLKAVAESVLKPLSYWDNNVFGSYNLISCMKENNCKTIVFSSSATVYGISSESLLLENTPLNPINPYGSTKLAVENLLNDINQDVNENWKIAILRYFNPIGAHNSGLLGENPLQKPNNIFPIIINAAYKKEKLKVFGNDWPTNDGTCIRDYIHVMDLAEGHIKALNHLFTQKKQLIHLNIGTGLGHSVLDLIKTFETVNEVKVPFQICSRRDGDVCKLVANNSKAKEILNWNPIRSLHEMCKDGWHWKLMNPKGYIL